MTAAKMQRRKDLAPITIEMIHARSIEDGDCWVWRGGCGHGTPHMSENAKSVPVRRWIAQHHLGKQIKGAFATNSCGNPLCVAPDHVLVVTRARLQKLVSDRIKYQKNPMRNAKISAKKRAQSKFSPDFVEQIRVAEGSQRAVAKRFGVSQDFVNKLRNGKVWKTYGSHWHGLGARS